MHSTTAGGNGGALGPAQVPTGVPGLDWLLDGGLRRGGLHVVLGGPGMGKSGLAHQIGSHVIRAYGGVEALTLARAEPPDLLLVDVMLPDLDGRDVCRLLKLDEQLRGIPVVLFSSADEYDVHWRHAGANAFLQKPFDVTALPGFVRDLLRGGA